jgi:hypothetical protein
MKISAMLAILLSVVFASVCMGFAITGFTSLGDIVDPVQASDAKGYAWFWTFLAAIALVFGLLSWWIIQTQKDEQDA